MLMSTRSYSGRQRVFCNHDIRKLCSPRVPLVQRRVLGDVSIDALTSSNSGTRKCVVLFTQDHNLPLASDVTFHQTL